MANRVLSIEVGFSLTKVCEMDYKVKNPKIYSSFVLETPDGMINDGIIKVNENFIKNFQSAMNEKKIHTKQAIFTVTSSKIATREAKIPYCKEKRIVDVIRTNLSDYFPIDTKQYKFSHTVLGKEMPEQEKNDDLDDSIVKKPTEKPTGYKLLLLAAPKPLLDGYDLLAKALGLEVVAIDYCGNSLFQAAKDECSEGTQLIIKVDERSSFLMVLKNGVIVLNRTIAYGIDDAVDALSETKFLGEVGDYETTLQLARRKTCILSNMDLESQNDIIDLENPNYEAVRADKIKVTESLQPLLSGIARVIDYYNSNHSNDTIEKIYVTGVGADFSGLSTLLTNEIGTRIRNLTHLSGINLEKAFKEVSFGEYVTCIGAAISPMTFYTDEEGKKGKNGSSGLDMGLISKIVLILGVAIGIILIVMNVLPYAHETKLKKEYTETISELQPAYDTYLAYQQAMEESGKLEALDALTVNRNEDIISFFYTLEQKMPSTFCLNTLSVTNEDIVLDVSVASKEEVAAVVSELRNTTLFSLVDITSITELETEIGETQYGFTVNLTYAPIVSETEEQGE